MGGVDGGHAPEMLVSPEDKRIYRMVLLGNGLTALLVHDPEIAACMQDETQESEEEDQSADDEHSGSQRKRRKKSKWTACCARPGSDGENSPADGMEFSEGDEEGED